MKIICTQENLKKGLQTVGRIISGTNTLPVLNNILFRTENGSLVLTATNLELAMKTSVRCKVEEEGAVTIPAKTIIDLISNLPNQNISLFLEGTEVVVSTEDYTTKLHTFPAEDFPLIPTVDSLWSATLPALEFKQSLEQVIFATALSESQPIISGVNFKAKENEIVFAATDRYRLAEKKLLIKNTTGTQDVVIPHRTAIEISRLIVAGDLEVSMVLADNQMAIRVGSVELVSRLIDGQYLDYHQIFPTEFQTIVSVDRQQFVNALKTSSIFSKLGNSVLFRFSPETKNLIVSSSSQDVGESQVTLSGEVSGPAGQVLLNYKYVLDALNTMEEEKVLFKVFDNSSLVVLVPEGNENYTYLVKPISV
jgi:DNA polymerase-3 subunit beta